MQNTKPFIVRDKRNKGWFYLDNEYLNGLGKHMGPIGIAVYVSLCRHADGQQTCFPAQELIAEETGVGERTVRKYIDLLKKYNVIAVEREKKGRKWANNLYYLLDKSQWQYPKEVSQAPDASDVHRQIKTVSQASDDTVHRHQMPTKDTNRTIPIKKTNIANVPFADINKHIELFKPVNPTYTRLFSNKTERAALERMLSVGVERFEQIMKAVVWSHNRPFAPVITTPLQLERKMGELQAFVQRENNNKPKVLKI